MSIRIQVSSTDTRDTRYTSKRTGKPDKEQTVWAFLTDRSGNPDPHPTRINVLMAADDQPYPVGDYTLHPSSFYVGDYGKLTLTTRLAPIKPKG